MEVGIEVENIDEVRKALRGFEGGTDDLKAVHAEAAQVGEQAVRTPRRTGRLQATVRSSGQARKGVIRAGSASVPYAGVIHWGWPRRGIRPTPFLRDAGDRQAPQIAAVYDAGLERLADQYGLAG